jgi:hypothetical protein
MLRSTAAIVYHPNGQKNKTPPLKLMRDGISGVHPQALKFYVMTIIFISLNFIQKLHVYQY